MILDDFVTERVGRTIDGRWHLVRALGAGGMAAVYEAEGANGERAAVKILHPEMSVRRDVRERFLREGLAANRVQHPGAVHVLEQGTSGEDCVYLAMELLRGETLAERASRHGTLPVAEILRVMDEVLDVLAAAHAQGIVHRDIKPDNLFVTEAGSLKVLDFGLARLLDAMPGDFRTRSGLALGTFPYMAPEQALGRRSEIDGRVDLFALGASAFRIVARRRVHEAESEAELLMAMASKPAPPLASVTTGLPDGLCRIIDLALAFAREARYPDARTMQADVRAVIHGEPPPFALGRAAVQNEPTFVGGRGGAARVGSHDASSPILGAVAGGIGASPAAGVAVHYPASAGSVAGPPPTMPAPTTRRTASGTAVMPLVAPLPPPSPAARAVSGAPASATIAGDGDHRSDTAAQAEAPRAIDGAVSVTARTEPGPELEPTPAAPAGSPAIALHESRRRPGLLPWVVLALAGAMAIAGVVAAVVGARPRSDGQHKTPEAPSAPSLLGVDGAPLRTAPVGVAGLAATVAAQPSVSESATAPKVGRSARAAPAALASAVSPTAVSRGTASGAEAARPRAAPTATGTSAGAASGKAGGRSVTVEIGGSRKGRSGWRSEGKRSD